MIYFVLPPLSLSKKLVKLCLLTCLLCLFSCSSLTNKPLNYDVTLPDPNRIRFEGKGAAAGMMLSGTMGPMGMAIGIAIDEGISKKIDATATEYGFTIEDVLRAEFMSIQGTAFMDKHVFDASSEYSHLIVKVIKYGFKTYPGDGDLVIPVLELEFVLDDVVKYQLSFPGAYIKDIRDDSHLPAGLIPSLDDIKNKGQVIQKSFSAAVSFILED